MNYWIHVFMLQMERHRSPLIVSDMIHIRDEISSTQDFLIAGKSKIFDVFITILYFKNL